MLLFESVRVGDKGECWYWNGFANGAEIRDRYGIVKFMGVTMNPCRAAVMIRYGTRLSRVQLACHLCDNKPCCNPYHLYVGTARQNIMDSFIRSGRMVGGRIVFAKEDSRFNGNQKTPLQQMILREDLLSLVQKGGWRP